MYGHDDITYMIHTLTHLGSITTEISSISQNQVLLFFTMPLGMKAMKAIKPAGKKAAAAAPTKKTMNAMKVVD